MESPAGLRSLNIYRMELYGHGDSIPVKSFRTTHVLDLTYDYISLNFRLALPVLR